MNWHNANSPDNAEMCPDDCKTSSGVSRVIFGPRGRFDRIVVIYGQAVRFFSRWLEDQSRQATVDELTRPAIREWLAQLADRHEASTVKTRYRGLFRFCGWLVDEDELEAHPMKTLGPPEPRNKPVPVLTDDELTALLKTCAGKDFAQRRDEAGFRLLLDCGPRVSELCALTVEGVDLDLGMALVRGKEGVQGPPGLLRRSHDASPRPLRPHPGLASLGTPRRPVPDSTWRKWLRIAALAYGSHENNGHARFKRGEVALMLAVVDHETGEVIPADRRDVFLSIQQAIAYGWPRGRVDRPVPDRACARHQEGPTRWADCALPHSHQGQPMSAWVPEQRQHSVMTFASKRLHSVMTFRLFVITQCRRLSARPSHLSVPRYRTAVS